MKVSHCYPEEVKEFPDQIRDLLKRHSTVLDPLMRMVTKDFYLKSLLVALKVTYYDINNNDNISINDDNNNDDGCS